MFLLSSQTYSSMAWPTCYLLMKLSVWIKHFNVFTFHKRVPCIIIQHTTPLLSVEIDFCQKQCQKQCQTLLLHSHFSPPYQFCCKLSPCTRDGALVGLHIRFLLSPLQYCSLGGFKQRHILITSTSHSSLPLYTGRKWKNKSMHHVGNNILLSPVLPWHQYITTTNLSFLQSLKRIRG